MSFRGLLSTLLISRIVRGLFTTLFMVSIADQPVLLTVNNVDKLLTLISQINFAGFYIVQAELSSVFAGYFIARIQFVRFEGCFSMN